MANIFLQVKNFNSSNGIMRLDDLIYVSDLNIVPQSRYLQCSIALWIFFGAICLPILQCVLIDKKLNKK